MVLTARQYSAKEEEKTPLALVRGMGLAINSGKRMWSIPANKPWICKGRKGESINLPSEPPLLF